MLYGILFKRGEFIKELMPVTVRSINLTAVVFFLLGCVGVFQFLLANKGWPQDLANWVGYQGLSQMGFLLFVLGVLLVLSMFLTGVALIVLTVPIFFPVALSLGVDPIHLGIIMVVNMEIDMITPPVGLNLFVTAGVAGMSVMSVVRAALPWVGIMFIFLILVTYVPIISTYLPTALMGPEIITQ